jgi:hypothetical protein
VLAPLRAALAEAVPGAARPQPPFIPRSAKLRLYWRVVEIHDAMLALRSYGGPYAAAGPTAMKEEDASTDHAVMGARLLASAVAAKRAGWLPRPSTATQAVAPGGMIDLRAEAEWLAQMARAYTRLQREGESGDPRPPGSARDGSSVLLRRERIRTAGNPDD